MSDADQFVAVTGVGSDVARHYLDLSGGELAAALDLYFAQPDLVPDKDKDKDKDNKDLPLSARLRRKPLRNGQAPSSSSFSTRAAKANGAGQGPSSSSSSTPQLVDLAGEEEAERRGKAATKMDADEDGVRAPIPATSGVLVNASFADSYAGPRRVARGSVFEAGADFRAVAEAQRRQLMAGGEVSSSSSSSSKRELLAELFRPPAHLIFKGSWEEAKAAAVIQHRWLLVNVQTLSEFACQTLNRDVWRNGTVEALLSGNFIFWQVSDESAEGRRFQAYYPTTASQRPFVGVVDPRTGELAKEWRRLSDPATFCDLASQLLAEWPNFQARDHQLSSSSTAMAAEAGKTKKRRGLAEAAEEVAAKAARVEAEAEAVRGRLEQSALSAASGQDFASLCSQGGRPLRLQIRFPDERRRLVELGDETRLAALMALAAEEGFSPDSHQLLLTFPKRCLSEHPPSTSLAELGLKAQEIVYVERR